MTLGLWEETSEGVWLNYFTWQQNHRTGLHWGLHAATNPPTLLLWGSRLQIQCLEKYRSSFAKRQWSLWEATNAAGADGEVPGNC